MMLLTTSLVLYRMSAKRDGGSSTVDEGDSEDESGPMRGNSQMQMNDEEYLAYIDGLAGDLHSNDTTSFMVQNPLARRNSSSPATSKLVVVRRSTLTTARATPGLPDAQMPAPETVFYSSSAGEEPGSPTVDREGGESAKRTQQRGVPAELLNARLSRKKSFLLRIGKPDAGEATAPAEARRASNMNPLFGATHNPLRRDSGRVATPDARRSFTREQEIQMQRWSQQQQQQEDEF